ncbi:MAG: BMC domain-containing protein [Planctomycetota bacterium]|nr:BMC domain-containing protein [Planctomycetota bacterium]
MTRNDYNPRLREGAPAAPCIGLLEFATVPRGIEAADALLWEATVELLFSAPVQPGKYVILFSGSVDDVRSALRRGEEIGGQDVIDRLHIPQVHEQVEVALRRKDEYIEGKLDAIGVIETTTVASAIQAADRALKKATVDLFDLRIANGLGGKSFLCLVGEVSDVRAAVAEAAGAASEAGRLSRDVVIANPHEELSRYL